MVCGGKDVMWSVEVNVMWSVDVVCGGKDVMWSVEVRMSCGLWR